MPRKERYTTTISNSRKRKAQKAERVNGGRFAKKKKEDEIIQVDINVCDDSQHPSQSNDSYPSEPSDHQDICTVSAEIKALSQAIKSTEGIIKSNDVPSIMLPVEERIARARSHSPVLFDALNGSQLSETYKRRIAKHDHDVHALCKAFMKMDNFEEAKVAIAGSRLFGDFDPDCSNESLTQLLEGKRNELDQEKQFIEDQLTSNEIFSANTVEYLAARHSNGTIVPSSLMENGLVLKLHGTSRERMNHFSRSGLSMSPTSCIKVIESQYDKSLSEVVEVIQKGNCNQCVWMVLQDNYNPMDFATRFYTGRNFTNAVSSETIICVRIYLLHLFIYCDQ